MTNTQSRDIDGLTVEVTKFKPRRALRVMTRLVRTFGPAIVPFIEQGTFSKGDARSFMLGLQSLSEDVVDELAAVLLEGTVVSGHAEFVGRQDLKNVAKIDLVFDDVLTLFKACAFSLEVNFRNFSEAAATTLGSQPEATESPSS